MIVNELETTWSATDPAASNSAAGAVRLELRGAMGRQLLFALLLVVCAVADTEPEHEQHEHEPVCFDDSTPAPSQCQPSTCAHVMLNTLPKSWAARIAEVDLFGEVRCVAYQPGAKTPCYCVAPSIATLADLEKVRVRP